MYLHDITSLAELSELLCSLLCLSYYNHWESLTLRGARLREHRMFLELQTSNLIFGFNHNGLCKFFFPNCTQNK